MRTPEAGRSKRREAAVEVPIDFRIAEMWSVSKNSERKDEDRIVIGTHCAAVIDGVSQGSAGNSIEGFTPGQFATRIGAQAILEASRANVTDPAEFVNALSARLRRGLDAVHPAYDGFLPRFVFAAYLAKSRSIIRVGDCSIRFVGEPIEATVARNPELAIDAERRRLRAEHNDPGRAWQHLQENNPDSPFGYGDIAPHAATPASFIDIFPVAPGTQLILASDGYPPETLRDSLSETNAAYEAYAREFPELLHLDDRTYVRIET